MLYEVITLWRRAIAVIDRIFYRALHRGARRIQGKERVQVVDNDFYAGRVAIVAEKEVVRS